MHNNDAELYTTMHSSDMKQESEEKSRFGIARFADSIRTRDKKPCSCPSIARENQEKLLKARAAARRLEY